MEIILLIIGFLLLIKGADYFVDGSASIAKKMGIPAVIVGLTIVSLGTSAPEFSVSIISSIQGNNGITVGNIIGSNIFNTLVVLGISALMAPFIIKKCTVKRDFIVNTGAILLVVMATFGIMLSGKDTISRLDGILLLVACALYTIMLIISAKNTEMEDSEIAASADVNVKSKLVIAGVGLVGIILGGKLVVDSASSIALALGMSETLVGLTIVAVGTSLPELVTSVVAIMKGENDIALGNVLGSNTYNILLILGASATISPIAVSASLIVDLMFLLAITLFFAAIVFINKKEEKTLSKLEAGIMVALYIAYTIYIIYRG